MTERRVPVLRLTLAVAGVIAGLAAIDVSLEKTEQMELANQALKADRSGQNLLAHARVNEALDAFRKAHALERDNVSYELHLIEALMAAGKTAEAQPLMTDILAEESNNGEANLVAARLAAQQGHITAADSFYHRAIYGEWPDNLSEHQIQTRLELIYFLMKTGKDNEILAELLPLEEQVGKDPALQARVARLFLVAGTARRAADIFHELIRANPKDGSNWEGLGEAELDEGDFRLAHGAFENAMARNGHDPKLQARVELADQLSSLDPTPRWLSTQDKYSRSVRIVQMASTDLEHCITNHPELATDTATQLVTTAHTDLAAAAPKQVTNSMAESYLTLAQQIWRTRTSLCGPGTDPGDEALRLIMEKVQK